MSRIKLSPATTYIAALILAVLLIPTAFSDPNPVQPTESQLHKWLTHTIRSHQAGRDKKFMAAEENLKIIKVRKDGAGDFTVISDAVKSIPAGNRRRVVIWIGKGEYREKITVEMWKPFVTFYGEGNGNDNDMPMITYDGTALKYGTVDSATVAVDSDYFVAVNIAFVNSAPMPDGKTKGAQAVAMRISGDKAAFYNCKFIGFQDTLCDDRGRHFFKDCYIQGSVDFIFGNGKSFYLRSTIHSVAEHLGVITAQARASVKEDTGFTFVYCKITGNGCANTYLGRNWKGSASVVFAYSYMASLINPQGWIAGQQAQQRTTYYGEYMCMGPGAAFSGRTKLAKKLSKEEAKPYLTMTYICGGKWIMPPPRL